MRKILLLVVIGAMSCGVVLYWQMRTQNQIDGIKDIDRLWLYSLDGRGTKELEQTQFDEYFHAIPVLGKLEVAGPAERKELLSALNRGIAEGDRQANCFWPRHGIRIEKNGKSTDFVICFHCYYMKKISPDTEQVVLTSRSPKATFVRMLTNAQIPLAPED